MSKKLNEGLRFGEREISMVKSKYDMFQMGVEYEFHTKLVYDAVDMTDHYDTTEFIEGVTNSQTFELSKDYAVEILEGNRDQEDFVRFTLPLFGGSGYYVYVHPYIGIVDEDCYSSYDTRVYNVFYRPFTNQLTLAVNAVFVQLNNAIKGEDVDLESLAKYKDLLKVVSCMEFSEDEVESSFIAVINDYTLINDREFISSLSEEIIETIDDMGDEAGERIGIDDYYVDRDFFIRLVDHFDVGRTIATPPEMIDDVLEYEDINFYEVKPDDGQCEVVSYTMPIEDGIEHIEKMFEFISNNGETKRNSGMHISISNREPEKVDLLKFLSLMEYGFTLTAFLGGNAVNDIRQRIVEAVNALFITDYDMDGFDPSDMRSFIMFTAKYIRNSNVFDENKYQSIKFSDYTVYNGRIELRYFGGEDYHERYDEVIDHVHRALYTLMVASDNDLFHKEYLKGLYKLIVSSLEMYGLDVFKIVKYAKKIRSFKTEDEVVAFLEGDNVENRYVGLLKNWGSHVTTS